MSRPSTLPPTWAALATSMGGVSILAQRLGLTTRMLGRIAHGEAYASADVAIAIAALGLVPNVRAGEKYRSRAYGYRPAGDKGAHRPQD